MTSKIYADSVAGYVHSNEKLDTAIQKLWWLWKEEGEIPMREAETFFLEATTEAIHLGNIGSPNTYVPHCFEVSRRCAETAKLANEHYDLGLDPTRFAFKGLTEDSFYLIGGSEKNNPNGLSSNPVHEILTYVQMLHMGYDDLAKGMAMHFVAPQVLDIEHAAGRFTDVEMPNENLPLTILTGVDALCTTMWLPDKVDGLYEHALAARIADIIPRRREIDPNHPLVVGYDNGGKKRLEDAVGLVESLRKGIIDFEEVQDLYLE
jgi:hypothetical protein